MSDQAQGSYHHEPVDEAAMIPQLHAGSDLTAAPGLQSNHLTTSPDDLAAPANPWVESIGQLGGSRIPAAVQHQPGTSAMGAHYQAHAAAAGNGGTTHHPFDSPAVTSASEHMEVSPSPELMPTVSTAVWKPALDVGGGMDYGSPGDGEGGGVIPADMPPVGPECDLPASMTEGWGLSVTTRVFTTTKPPKLYQVRVSVTETS
jgi:hypothetical protein